MLHKLTVVMLSQCILVWIHAEIRSTPARRWSGAAVLRSDGMVQILRSLMGSLKECVAR